MGCACGGGCGGSGKKRRPRLCPLVERYLGLLPLLFCTRLTQPMQALCHPPMPPLHPHTHILSTPHASHVSPFPLPFTHSQITGPPPRPPNPPAHAVPPPPRRRPAPPGPPPPPGHPDCLAQCHRGRCVCRGPRPACREKKSSPHRVHDGRGGHPHPHHRGPGGRPTRPRGAGPDDDQDGALQKVPQVRRGLPEQGLRRRREDPGRHCHLSPLGMVANKGKESNTFSLGARAQPNM